MLLGVVSAELARELLLDLRVGLQGVRDIARHLAFESGGQVGVQPREDGGAAGERGQRVLHLRVRKNHFHATRRWA